MRLQKYLADCGIASRRTCEELIAQGLVRVNGEKITQMGFIVDPERDTVVYK
ncbi:MAG: S4 domain-containing protein, partial [Eubacteriales bacterium]